MEVFGLGIGGSGIKGAPVEVESGELPGDRARVPTPEAARPDEVVAAVEVASRSGWEGPVGCGFPGMVKEGVIHTATNVADEFIGFDLQTRLQKELGKPVRILQPLAVRLNCRHRVCMRAYSIDLRQKIVEAVQRGMSKAQAARAFGVGISLRSSGM